MKTYSSDLWGDNVATVIQLAVLSISTGIQNQNKISILEELLSDYVNTMAESGNRISPIEEKLANLGKSPSESMTSSKEYLHERFAYGIDITPSAHIETPKKDTLSKRFLELKERWRQETAFTSSPRDLFLHSAYQKIIGLGPEAVPLVLAELRDEPGLWLWALQAMNRDNPIPDDFKGGIEQVAELWLEWGRRNGIAV